MQDKPKVQKASPKERKSERSENGKKKKKELLYLFCLVYFLPAHYWNLCAGPVYE